MIGAFEIEFDAIPSASNIDAVIGFSDGRADQFSDLIATVRFNEAGYIDVRGPEGYRADAALAYAAGQRYRFRVSGALQGGVYNVDVTPPGGGEVRLARDLGFRYYGARQITHRALIVDSTTGSLEVCNFTIRDPSCLEAREGAWQSRHSFSAMSGSYTLRFDAAVSERGGDALVGISSDVPSGYSDLATAVRFNEDGYIDVRHGNRYMADVPVAYVPGERYEFSLDVSHDSHQYDVWVHTRSGSLPQTRLARAYAFRSEQSDVRFLRHHTAIVDAGGTLNVCNFVQGSGGPCPSAVAGRGWMNTVISPASQAFSVVYTVSPASKDVVVGLSNGKADAFSDLAAIVRFNPDGYIDARSGSVYQAVAAVPYTEYMEYRVIMDVDLPNRTYSARVRLWDEGGEKLVPIAENFAFRTEQSGVSVLNNLAAFIDAPIGDSQVCSIQTGDVPPPL